MALNISGVRLDPVPSFNFLITMIDTSGSVAGGFTTALSAITNTILGGFSECSGLEMSLEVHDHQEGGANGAVKKFPTRVTWPNITLKRGVGFSEDLWNWHFDYVQGKGKRRDGIIILQNDLHIPIKVWHFIRGLPARWTGPSLDAGKSGVAIESLEIAHEGMKVYSLGSGISGLSGVSF